MSAKTLKDLRTDAGHSQSQLAKLLEAALPDTAKAKKEIHVSTISRWEANPDDVPAVIYRAWLAVCGQAFVPVTTATHSPSPLDAGSPYERLESNIDLLERYVASCPVTDDSSPTWSADVGAARVHAFLSHCRQLAGKPVVGVFGRFDAGKSSLVNSFLGGNILPTSYQPTTALPTLLVHKGERPEHIKHAVALLDVQLGAEVTLAAVLSDPAVYRDHLLLEGPTEVLNRYGQHVLVEQDDDPVQSRVRQAIVFLDAPILRSCVILDSPGFAAGADQAGDSGVAESLFGNVDVVVYCSPFQTFLDEHDLLRLPRLARQAGVDAEELGTDWLDHTYLIATHAGPQVSDEQIDGGLGKASLRLARTFEVNQSSDTPTAERLRQRVSTFWHESSVRSLRVRTELPKFLGETLAPARANYVDRWIEEFRSKTTQALRETIDGYTRRLEEYRETVEAASEELARCEKGADNREEQIEREYQSLLGTIEACRDGSTKWMESRYAALVNTDKLEALIPKRFNEKSEAQKEIAPLLLGMLEHEMGEALREQTEQFDKKLKLFIDSYGRASSLSRTAQETIGAGFNWDGAFVGGMAGLLSVGAVALYASTLGNLGAYILVSQAVGVLSFIGISLPAGVASATASIAAIGGPLTIGIGLIVLAVLAGLMFFGSWEKRLAKTVVSKFKEKGVCGEFVHAIEEFWNQTTEAVRAGRRGMDEEWERRLGELRNIANDSQVARERFTRENEKLKRLLDFFVGFPWSRAR